ncbi:hypothetical protein Syun_010301 [Stephania yunnanensis]|uniref:Uncharacterized protein n=1 Tax=Stephania yunnanensis TaxID=152371 RepID=A0AAP0KG90_9MAGN
MTHGENKLGLSSNAGKELEATVLQAFSFLFFFEKLKKVITYASMSSGRPIVCCRHTADDIARKSANFHPSIWGDYFLNCANDDVRDAERESVGESAVAKAEQTCSKLISISK